MAKYEYVAVELPQAVKRGERADDAITNELNRVAEHGWRLTAIYQKTGLIPPHAIFERSR